jgi:predicted Zn-dependent peptidase
MYDPYAAFTKHVLPNGLEVHLVSWDRPWIKMGIVVHSGGREDPVSMPGLAHFVEHVVSGNIPGLKKNQVEVFLESHGGHGDFGATNYLSTEYEFRTLADPSVFRTALSMFGSMLLQAQLNNGIEREREVILREFNDRYHCSEQLEWDMHKQRAVFAGHRLETWNRPLGRPEGFMRTTQNDLQQFYDTHYTPANMSVVIVGGLPIDTVIAELEQSPFGIPKYGVRNPIPKPWDGIRKPVEHSKLVRLSDHTSFTIDRTEYIATWAFPVHFPRQALRVFDYMLEEILFEQIRTQRCAAYNFSTGPRYFQDVYEYTIGGNINPRYDEQIDDLVTSCIAHIPERRALFEQNLNYCKCMCMMTDIAGTGLMGNNMGDLMRDHRIVTLQDTLDELQQVTFEQMQEAAQLLSPDRRYTFMCCP